MLDIIIILFILLGALIGFKRGIIKQSVITIGMILVLILSFILKNPVSSFLYEHLPFFNIGGLYNNASILNILVYEVIAFFIVFSILSIIYLLIVKVSSIIEKLLKVTVILAIPSKILGAIFGILEYYLIVFIVLFVLMQPTFGLNDVEFFSKSNLRKTIIDKTPIVSKYISPTVDTVNEVTKLTKDKEEYTDEEFNCKITDIMVKNKVITKKSLNYLIKEGKIKDNCEKGE